jgi:hypothetical protein
MVAREHDFSVAPLRRLCCNTRQTCRQRARTDAIVQPAQMHVAMVTRWCARNCACFFFCLFFVESAALHEGCHPPWPATQHASIWPCDPQLCSLHRLDARFVSACTPTLMCSPTPSFHWQFLVLLAESTSRRPPHRWRPILSLALIQTSGPSISVRSRQSPCLQKRLPRPHTSSCHLKPK